MSAKEQDVWDSLNALGLGLAPALLDFRLCIHKCSIFWVTSTLWDVSKLVIVA